MMKYVFAITLMFLPLAASALTSEQELLKKCEMGMAKRTKLHTTSIYADKRLCPCTVQEIKKSVSAEKLQELADFYTEISDNYENKDYKTTRSSERGCINKFYTPEQQDKDRKDSMKALDAFMKKNGM